MTDEKYPPLTDPSPPMTRFADAQTSLAPRCPICRGPLRRTPDHLKAFNLDSWVCEKDHHFSAADLVRLQP
jgi:hypothetical protein